MPSAQAAGGSYSFVGGSPAERSEVVQALNASAFPWQVLPQTIVVRIGQGFGSEAAPGTVWLDPKLLDEGRFSWAVVQHEFAHQIDFLLLTDADRARLQALLGGVGWWSAPGGRHGDAAAERFASEVAWAYWPSPDNVLAPAGPDAEAGHVPADAFRSILASLVPGANADARLLAVVTRGKRLSLLARPGR